MGRPNNHRTHVTTRDDWDKPWRLKMWRNPKVKKRLVRCAFCSGKELAQIKRRREYKRSMDRRFLREALDDEL